MFVASLEYISWKNWILNFLRSTYKLSPWFLNLRSQLDPGFNCMPRRGDRRGNSRRLGSATELWLTEPIPRGDTLFSQIMLEFFDVYVFIWDLYNMICLACFFVMIVSYTLTTTPLWCDQTLDGCICCLKECLFRVVTILVTMLINKC